MIGSDFRILQIFLDFFLTELKFSEGVLVLVKYILRGRGSGIKLLSLGLSAHILRGVVWNQAIEPGS